MPKNSHHKCQDASKNIAVHKNQPPTRAREKICKSRSIITNPIPNNGRRLGRSPKKNHSSNQSVLFMRFFQFLANHSWLWFQKYGSKTVWQNGRSGPPHPPKMLLAIHLPPAHENSESKIAPLIGQLYPKSQQTRDKAVALNQFLANSTITLPPVRADTQNCLAAQSPNLE